MSTQNNSEHGITKGPWEYQSASERDKKDGYAYTIYLAGTSIPLVDVISRDGAEDIARLIAGAPELLSSLKHSVRFHDQLNPTDIERHQKIIEKCEPRRPMKPEQSFLMRAGMEMCGGSFMEALATAMGRAGEEDRAKILAAFPEIEREYGPGSSPYGLAESKFLPKGAKK